MSAHRFHTDQLTALAGPGILGVDSNNVVQLHHRSGGTFKPAGTGPYTFSNVAAYQVGAIVYVVPTAAAVLKNAAGSTFATCVSGQPMLVQAMTTSSWAVLAQGFADVGGFTLATDTNGAIQSALRESQVLRAPMATYVDTDGDPLAKFVDNASPNPGFTLANSKAFGIRWNNNATQGQPVLNSIKLLQDSGTNDMTMHIIASKTGATVGDATTFTVTAFAIGPGGLHDASSDCGGVSTAMTGNAAAKTVQHVTVSFAFDDIQGFESLTYTITPTSGTLGADDVIIEDIYFTCPAA